MHKFHLEEDQSEVELNKGKQDEADCDTKDAPSMSRKQKKKRSVFGTLGELFRELVGQEEAMHRMQVSDCMMGRWASPTLRIDDVETAKGTTSTSRPVIQDPKAGLMKESSPRAGKEDLTKETITDPVIVTSLPVVQ